MFTIAKKIFGPARTREKKGEDVLVSLLDVAGRAGENEVVAPIISALAFSGRHVIEGDPFLADATTTVRANGTVAIQQPFACVGVCVPARRE